jgi:hypothetical protein
MALGTYVAQDLRDPDGAARSLLRRAAVHMVTSSRQPVRRLGSAYVRIDPPALELLSEPADAGRPLLLPSPEPPRSSARVLESSSGGEPTPD